MKLRVSSNPSVCCLLSRSYALNRLYALNRSYAPGHGVVRCADVGALVLKNRATRRGKAAAAALASVSYDGSLSGEEGDEEGDDGGDDLATPSRECASVLRLLSHFPPLPIEIKVNHRSSNSALEHALQSDSASTAHRCSLCSSVCPSSPTSRSTAAGASARQSALRLWRVWWWRCLRAKSPAAPPRPPSTRPSPPWLQRGEVGCNGCAPPHLRPAAISAAATKCRPPPGRYCWQPGKGASWKEKQLHQCFHVFIQLPLTASCRLT